MNDRKIYHQKWYQKNKIKVRKQHRKYIQSHPEQTKKYCERYHLNNPERWIYWSLLNRAKRKTFKIKFTLKEFQAWYSKQKQNCTYCGISQQDWVKTKDSLNSWMKRLQLDRKVPGIDYTLDNIVLACPRCNLTKSDFFDFNNMKKIGKIINESRKYF
jgi:hypothetical protein